MQQQENLTPDKKNGIWGLVDNIKGDKVVWIIVFMLLMISVLSIFSSTSMLAQRTGTDRVALMKEQIWVTIGGLGVIVFIYKLFKLGILRFLSKFGFIFSLGLLLILVLRLDLGFIRAEEHNEAVRNLIIGNTQIHVFEMIKVAMVMYVSWAIHTCRLDEESGDESQYFRLINTLGEHPNLKFLKHPFCKRAIYIYIPILVTTLMILSGSNSSALLMGAVMGSLLIIGRIKTKELILIAIAGICALGIAFSIYKISDGNLFRRMSVFEYRVGLDTDPEQLLKLKGEKQRKLRDAIIQPNTAKIAIQEGGLIGKGPGGSTQKYIVPLMFSDYIFSFILEEYGIFGGLFIILLYLSLLARGIWITRLCESDFAKIVVGGLTLMITSQAFLHMYINVDMGPLTGQTLPLISHGKGAFLSFCVAFGIILSISRMANKKMRKLEEQIDNPNQQNSSEENTES